MSRLALQLYTVRDECAAAIAGALGQTASLGFEGVEVHDLHGRSAQEVRGLLDRYGLEACARHTLLEAVESDPEGLARELEALGTDRRVVAWIPPPRTARVSPNTRGGLYDKFHRGSPWSTRTISNMQATPSSRNGGSRPSKCRATNWCHPSCAATE